MKRKLFGTDGIRGRVGDDISPTLAYKVGQSLAFVLKQNTNRRPNVILATDTRASCDTLSLAICAGLTCAGANVTCLGVLPTPAVAYLTGYMSADAGVMISASHNPFYCNGIKIFDKNSIKLSDELELSVEKHIFEESDNNFSYDGRINFADMSEAYISHLIEANKRRIKNFRIGVDTSNGATYKVAKTLFTRLGINALFIGDRPDGKNINLNCGSTSLESLSAFVKENSLDLGLAFDGDGDRLLAVDERGNEINGDVILAICASDMSEHGILRGGIVGTVMSNLGLKKFCEEKDFGYFEAKVGDRYVLENMLSLGYNLGGEQSGHLIFSEHSTAGDGMLSAIKLLEAVSFFEKPLSELSGMIKIYPQVTLNIEATKEEKKLLTSSDIIKEAYEKETALLSGNGRIILRASGTEDLIRIMVEGLYTEEISAIAKRLRSVILNELSK